MEPVEALSEALDWVVDLADVVLLGEDFELVAVCPVLELVLELSCTLLFLQPANIVTSILADNIKIICFKNIFIKIFLLYF
jgi:hypothetical protein